MIVRSASLAVVLGLCPVTPAFAGSPGVAGVDSTPPVIRITSPARGEFVSGSAQVTVQGTATDSGSGVARVDHSARTHDASRAARGSRGVRVRRAEGFPLPASR